MAAPTYTGPQVTTDSGNVGFVNATLPSGTVLGDDLVIIAGSDATNTATFSAPDYASEGNAGDADSDAQIGVMYGSVTATNISDGYVVVSQTGNSEMWAALYVVDGGDGAIAGSTFSSSAPTNPHDLGSIIGLASDDYLLLAGLSHDGADGDPFTVDTTASDSWWDTATPTDIDAGTGSSESGGCVLETTATITTTGVLQIDAQTSDGGAYAIVAIAPGGGPSPQTVDGITGIASAEAIGSASIKYDQTVSTVGNIATAEAHGDATVLAGNVDLIPTGIATAEAHGSATLLTGNVDVIPTGVASAEIVGDMTVLAGNVDVVPTGIVSPGDAGGTVDYYFDAGISGPTDNDAAWADPDLDGFDGSLSTQVTSSLNGTIDTNELRATGYSGPVSGDAISQVRARIYGGVFLGDNNTINAEILDGGNSLGVAINTIDYLTSGWGSYVALDAPVGGWTWTKLDSIECVVYGSSDGAGTHKTFRQIDLEVTAGAVSVGTPQLDLTILTGGIASAETVGATTVLAGNVDVVPTGIATAEAIGALAVIPAGGSDQDLTGVGNIATAEAIGEPLLNYGMIVTGVTSEELVPEPVLLVGNVNIIPTGIATAEVVTGPFVEGDPSLYPAGIASQEAIGAASLQTEYTIVASGIASAEAIGSHITTTGYIFVPTGVPSGEAHGSALVNREITGAGGIATAEAIGSLEIIDTVNHITAIGIPTGEQIGEPAILGGVHLTSSIFTGVFHPPHRGIFRPIIGKRV